MTRLTGSLLLAAMLAGGAANAEQVDEARIRELVLETIRQNPEIVMEAVAILQTRQDEAQASAQKQVLNDQQELLERDPNAPVLGNPDGDVTIVEFFDYNCPYCRRAKPELAALLSSDGDIRVVMREWPILGDGSVFAAKAALAAREQGLYEAFHWAMMGMRGRAEEASVLRIAKEVGLDIDRLRQDMETAEIDEHIAASMQLAKALGFSGTPSFVIGEQLIPGFAERAQLEEAVARTRTALAD